MLRTCGNCFRFGEDWRDAKAKGLDERFESVGEYSRFPRAGVRPRCSCGGFEGETLDAQHKPCEYHKYRWTWNLNIWYQWHFKYRLSRWYCEHIRVPIGRRRPPAEIKEWSYGAPVCPHCGEMPYSDEQCVFCGQRLLPLPDEDEYKAEVKGGTVDDDGIITCGKCQSHDLAFSIHADGADFTANSFKCNRCGNMVKIKQRRRGPSCFC